MQTLPQPLVASHRSLPALAVACLLVAAGCESGPPLERSCSGNKLPEHNCLPNEYSVVEQAMVEPEEVAIDDARARLSFFVELAICDDSPVAHEVTVTARAKSDAALSDGGRAETVADVVTLVDDGMRHGDATAKDGVIDVNVPNPFVGTRVEPNTDYVLRFQPRALADCGGDECVGGNCDGEALETSYRTGPRLMDM